MTLAPTHTLHTLRGKYPRALDLSSTVFYPLSDSEDHSSALEIFFSRAGDPPLPEDQALLLWGQPEFVQLARRILSTLAPDHLHDPDVEA